MRQQVRGRKGEDLLKSAIQSNTTSFFFESTIHFISQLNHLLHSSPFPSFSFLQPYQFYYPSSMRRNYRITPHPQKQFIHTYHINEVPLPPYNPLEDPNLRHFFSNQKVNKHIQQMGFVYEPRRQYPYSNRRTKNAYKFHKDNSFEIPLTHQLKNSEVSKSFMFNSQRDLAESEDYRSAGLLSPVLKKRSQSDFFNNRLSSKIPSISEIISRRPSTQSQQRRIAISNEGKSNSRIFKRQSFSSNKIQNRKNPEND